MGALEHIPSHRTPRGGSRARGLMEREIQERPVQDREVSLPPTMWRLPRLALESAVDAVVDDTLVTAGHVREFLARAMAADDALATTYVQGLVDAGIPVETIYLDLLAPAARLMGEYWDADRCSFVDVTVAVGRLQIVLRDLSHRFSRVSATSTADQANLLLSCIPGEQHTLGLFMVAEFFVRDGWAVSVGAPVATVDLTAMVRAHAFDVIGFSIACDSHLGRLKRDIARVRRCSRNRHVQILLGGRSVADQPHLATRLGADAAAPDARTAPGIARGLIESFGSCGS